MASMKHLVRVQQAYIVIIKLQICLLKCIPQRSNALQSRLADNQYDQSVSMSIAQLGC